MFTPPPPSLPPTPQPVRITDFPHSASSEAFHRKLRMREAGLNNDLEENEVVVMELHTLAGERIQVQDVGYYRDTDTLMFQGLDNASNLCQIIAKVQGLQVLFRVLMVADEETTKRRRVGFTVTEEGRNDEVASG